MEFIVTVKVSSRRNHQQDSTRDRQFRIVLDRNEALQLLGLQKDSGGQEIVTALSKQLEDLINGLCSATFLIEEEPHEQSD